MDQKSAQTFGCFVGILLTIIVSQGLFYFLDFPMTVEYIIMGVLALIFCGIGIVIARLSSRRLPPQTPPVPPQNPPVLS